MTTQVQSHIHIALTLSVDAELSPIYKWKARFGSRSRVPKVYVTTDESINGVIQLQQLLDEDGEVVRKADMRFVVVCDNEYEEIDGFDAWDRVDLLEQMHGKNVKFVDNKHPDNGEDHTSFVRNMILFIGDVPDFDPMMTRFYVPVQLLDNSLT